MIALQRKLYRLPVSVYLTIVGLPAPIRGGSIRMTARQVVAYATLHGWRPAEGLLCISDALAYLATLSVTLTGEKV